MVLVGVGGVNRNTIFGITCQMIDGRWVEWKGKLIWIAI